MSAPIRVRLTYSGDVQGVGFRWRVAMIAGDYRAFGTIRNLPDGRVELDVEGSNDETERFFAVIRERLADHIEATEIEPMLPLRGLTTFTIVR